MKLDVTKLPLGEVLVAFVLGAVVLTFVLAFAFASGSTIEGGEAVGETPGLVQPGEEIAAANACTSCHSTTGEILIGPTWKGIYGGPVTLSDGTEVIVDEAYIRESILEPLAKQVNGFASQMPSYTMLSDDDIEALIALIQSLSDVQPAAGAPTPEGPSSWTIIAIKMGDNFFEPNEVTVAAGTMVTFDLANEGLAGHSMRIAGPDGEYNSDDDTVSDPDIIPSGSTATLTWQAPDQPGEIIFRCDSYPTEMVGTITVEEDEAAATPTPTASPSP